MTVQVDPARSRVDFTVDALAHTVHGDFQFKSGSLRFDPQTGAASGELDVSATSGESGNNGRDHKMHKQVLESATFPDIVFQPQRVIGAVPTLGGAGQVQIEGLMTMHGQSHPLTASGPVQINGGDISAELHFIVPYEQWGMKNPSTLFLRVSDKVEVTVHVAGHLAPISASVAGSPH